ncbi:hypothetical protein Bca52824_012450 [Brassica carinata]|uniref:Uncharacterized protein n=1 Tax=Brassica carinata TaxID=52824 RepID=A0A8X8B2C0_BRACI|nr:hypothetical protein Bca52824_012450 [Brassica carinata]
MILQEVLKAVSGKGDPVKNFYYDAQDGRGLSSAQQLRPLNTVPVQSYSDSLSAFHCNVNISWLCKLLFFRGCTFDDYV